MKIVSWNVNSLNVRLPHLLQWLQTFAPDVVGIQETKLEDHKFPVQAIEEAGYQVIYHGQKTYNGVALLSRKHSIDDSCLGVPDFIDEQKRVIAGTINGVRVINLYVVNGQDVGTDKYAYKLAWLDTVTKWIELELKKYPRLVVLGDFNIAPEARDVHNPEVWNDDHILTSAAERNALKSLCALGLRDAFRLKHEDAGIFSWWDYRQAAFRRDMGLRIDLTLVSDALKDNVIDAGIDREPRTWERPSDHAPAWVELNI